MKYEGKEVAEGGVTDLEDGAGALEIEEALAVTPHRGQGTRCPCSSSRQSAARLRYQYEKAQLSSRLGCICKLPSDIAQPGAGRICTAHPTVRPEAHQRRTSLGDMLSPLAYCGSLGRIGSGSPARFGLGRPDWQDLTVCQPGHGAEGSGRAITNK